MSSILNKFGRNNQTLGAQPLTQEQLLLQQQNQLYGTQPVYGGNVVSQQQLAIQQQQFQSGVIAQPAETIVAQPIIQESIRQDRVLEVQPVIHRDIERPVVNHIERHINEPAPLSRAGNIQHQPIVEQTFHDRVINEVQPIIHREVAIPQVEAIQQHYVERVVATPQHTRQVVYEQIPAQIGRGYIQQGIGSQTYLQSGLVNTGALSTYNSGFAQQQLLRQEQQQLLNPQSQYLANEFGMNQRGGLLQHQQLLPQNYGPARILAQGPTAFAQPAIATTTTQQTFIQQQPFLQQQYIQQQPFGQQQYIQQQPFIQTLDNRGLLGQQQYLQQQPLVQTAPFITASPLTSAAPLGAPLTGYSTNQGLVGAAPLTQQQYNQEIGKQTYAAQAAAGLNPNLFNNNNNVAAANRL